MSSYWTFTKVPKRTANSIERQIEDVIQGEVFSLNEKSRKFVMENLDPKGMITAKIYQAAEDQDTKIKMEIDALLDILLSLGFDETDADMMEANYSYQAKNYEEALAMLKEKVAKEGLVDQVPNVPTSSIEPMTMPYATYQGAWVTVWAEEAPADDNSSRKFEEMDRVQHIKNGKTGTIIQLQESKNVDKDIVILWDEINDGEWRTEVHPGEIIFLGEKATGDLLARAEEAKQMTREEQLDHEKDYEEKTRKVVQEELEHRAAARKEFSAQLTKKSQDRIDQLASRVVAKNASEFNTIVQAGVLSITSREHNYELAHASTVIDNYRDTVLHCTASVGTPNDLHIPVTISVLNMLAKTITDQYWMTRQGYVFQQDDGRWTVHSKRGNIIGGPFGEQKKATSYIRNIEYRKSRGLETVLEQ